MRKHFFYTILFCSLAQLTVHAQQTGVTARSEAPAAKGKSAKGESYFRIAEKEFTNQRFMYAVPFYKSSLTHSISQDSLARIHLAESYWQVKSYDSARKYFQYFESKHGATFFSSYRLAEIAGVQQHYADAVNIYRRIQKDYPAKYPAMVQNKIDGFSNIDAFLRDSLDHKLNLLDISSAQQDFSPQYYRGGMVFVSNRYSKIGPEKEFGWDGLPYANIYWVKDTVDLISVKTMPARVEPVLNSTIKANDDYTAATSNDNDIILVNHINGAFKSGDYHRLTKFTDDLDTKFNYGPLCFNKAGNRVYFTRNTMKNVKGRYNLEICVANLVTGGAWGPIKVLPFVEEKYDFYHPALSADESRLYFCSNRPGGKGGSDIYYVDITSDSTMQTLVPLDEKVNTPGDELFPTIQGDTLYFSSNGMAGLGGLDIYRTVADKGTWKTPVNIGYPLNSSYDDFGITFSHIEKNAGLLSSNRLGTDDIFRFKDGNNTIIIAGTVLDKITKRRLDSAKVVIREVIDGIPSKDSSVTNFTGNYRFPVKLNHAYQISFTRPRYTDDSVAVGTIIVPKDIDQPLVLLSPIPAAPAPVVTAKLSDRDDDGTPDVKDKCPDKKGNSDNSGCPDIQARLNELAKMVHFKTASAELTPDAIKPLTEAAEILNEFPNTTLAIEGHTDNRAPAPYNLDLSNRRANSVKNFFMNKGLKSNRFTSVVGYGLTKPIADNNTDEGRAMNRRVYIKATFY